MSRFAVIALLISGCATLSTGNDKMEWPDSKVKEVTPIACDEEVIHVQDEKPMQRMTEHAPPPEFVRIGFRSPVEVWAMTSPFGIRNDPIQPKTVRFHKGVDMGATLGTTVHAAMSGRVVQEGWGGGHGQRITLDHGGGVRTSYSHLSIALVSEGMYVHEGHPIGLVGDTGRATGPHLHFEVTVDGEPTDPLPLLMGSMVPLQRLSNR